MIGSLDPGVGQAGDARTGTQESTLRIAIGSGVFVVVQKLALGMDERPGLHQLRQETPRGAVRSKSWVFGESQLFECGDFEPLKKGCGVWLSKRSARRGRACQWFSPNPNSRANRRAPEPLGQRFVKSNQKGFSSVGAIAGISLCAYPYWLEANFFSDNDLITITFGLSSKGF